MIELTGDINDVTNLRVVSGTEEIAGTVTSQYAVKVVDASEPVRLRGSIASAPMAIKGAVAVGAGGSGGGGGVSDHSKLTGRDQPNQHPIGAIADLDAVLMTKIDDLEITETGHIYLLCKGVRVKGPYGPFGSGGNASPAIFSVTNTTGWLFTSVAENRPCVLSAKWSSVEDGFSTGAGTMQIRVNESLKTTMSVDQGDISIDVSDWLTIGSNSVKMSINDAYNNGRTLAFTIEVVRLSIESDFDGRPAFNGPVSYYYVPFGSVEKTVHFILDGEQIDTVVVKLSGQQHDYILPKQPHGSHAFEVYLTAEIGGATVESNHLYYDLICTEDGNTTPIIASAYRPVAVEQWDTFTIPYRVYNPQNLMAEIVQKVNGEVFQNLTVDRTEHTWSYYSNTVGDLLMSISCGDTVKNFTIPIVESSIAAVAVTNNLVLNLDAYGRSNQEADPLIWEDRGVSCKFTGFNLSSDGWALDESGVPVMRVGGDARLAIPLKLFEKDARTTGKTIELEFATRAVRNYESTLVSCMDGGRGLSITSQQAMAASAQSSIGTQYKEEEHIRLSFVIEKLTGSRMMLCYLNGICSGAVAYPDSDDFMQVTPVEISVGSSECTIDIYHVRVYDADLTRQQVLTNWIADTQVGTMKRSRYYRNNVYDDYGKIVIEKLPKDLPYLVLEAGVLPQFKGDKKKVSGYYVDPARPERSFRFTDAEIDVQGTSSQYYKVKNYKIKFKNGFVLADGTVVSAYSLHEDSVPVMVFTMKADVASSEGANNVVLAKLFNDLAPTKTPAQETDPRVRQTIDGHPIVIFWDRGAGPTFVGKYNFNNDKGTQETFGFAPGDQSWEILQNGTDRVGFKNPDFSGDDWKQDFEARYPEDNTDTTRLASFVAWVASTNTENPTGDELSDPVVYSEVVYTHDTAEYRLAKFVHELPYWADVDHSVFYYLFTLVFLCIDQREKNAFPTYIAALRLWIWLFYDADSSLGINNKGALAFSPFLEDIDYTEAGDPVFNGQANVFWTNIRLGFPARVESMYQQWRVDGLVSYEIVKKLFDDHQGKWPEAIFNEDMYLKCIAAWIEDGDASYLPMLLGKKELHRAWWLFNRFRYLDSKWVTGSSMANRIIIRAHARASVFLTGYVKMYGNVFFNALRVSKRMLETGVEYEFPWDASGAEDAVIGINDADLLTSLGDLSPLMVETIDLSKATHLTHLKLGDASPDYVNRNLLALTLGNNVLLRTIDVRNCVSLTQSVDASGCVNVEEVYFDGTAITGLSLPNGGSLKVLHLPETVVNLTIRNQMSLSEFVIPTYENITTLWLENVSDVINPLDILRVIPEKSRVRLIGVTMTADSFEDVRELIVNLDSMRGIDESNNNLPNAQVSGVIRIETLTQKEWDEFQEACKKYPSLSLVYQYKNDYVTFYDGDAFVFRRKSVINDVRVIGIDDGGLRFYAGSNVKVSDDGGIIFGGDNSG